LNDTFSSQLYVLSGVPQGSLLGHLLFFCLYKWYWWRCCK